MRKSLPVLLIFCLIAMAVGGYAFNLGALLSSHADPPHFFFALGYLLLWLALLITGVAIGSRALLYVYGGFWLIELVYCFLYLFALDTALGTLVFVGVPLLLLPVYGLEWPYSLLVSLSGSDRLYDAYALPFVIAALLMSFAGVAARRWRGRQSKPPRS